MTLKQGIKHLELHKIEENRGLVLYLVSFAVISSFGLHTQTRWEPVLRFLLLHLTGNRVFRPTTAGIGPSVSLSHTVFVLP